MESYGQRSKLCFSRERHAKGSPLVRLQPGPRRPSRRASPSIRGDPTYRKSKKKPQVFLGFSSLAQGPAGPGPGLAPEPALGPHDGQRDPKGWPKGARGHPKGSQRVAQDSQRDTKGRPKGAQGHPKGSQREPKVGHRCPQTAKRSAHPTARPPLSGSLCELLFCFP